MEAVKGKQYMYYVTLWPVCLTIVAMETQECILCVFVELHVTANYMRILR